MHAPSGIAINPSGDVFVTDTANRRIDKFEADGTFLATWGWGVDDGTAEYQICTSGCQAGMSGSGEGQFSGPSSLAIDGSGDVFVLDDTNNNVQRFSSNGTFETKWGSSGSAEGEFAGPRGIATDTSGNVYVADTYNERVQKFDGAGTFLRAWGFGVDTGANAFEICTSTCQAGSGYGDGSFDAPLGVAVDGSGTVYVADTFGNRLETFDVSGAYLSQMGEYGQAPKQFANPWSVAIGPSGHVYVTDATNQRVEEFNHALDQRLASWGRAGVEPGEFATPAGIAVDADGYVYVADIGNNRIQKFGPASTALSIKAPKSVSRGSKASITGALTSTDATCLNTQDVELKIGATSVATRATSAAGAFRFALKITHRTAVHVEFAGSLGCGASQSMTKTVRAS